MHKEALAVSDALRTKSDGQASLVVFTSENFSIISTILLLAVLEHVSITFAEQKFLRVMVGSLNFMFWGETLKVKSYFTEKPFDLMVAPMETLKRPFPRLGVSSSGRNQGRAAINGKPICLFRLHLFGRH